jgi:hypothetical protein
VTTFDILAAFRKRHGITQAELVALMRKHGYPTMQERQIYRWKVRPPRETTAAIIDQTLNTLEHVLRGR